MALFTHSYADNNPAEVNPAEMYFSEAVICRNYEATRSANRGTVYSSEYHRLEAEGFRFLGHLPGLPGKMSTDVIMVKPAAVAVEANAKWYGSSFAGFDVNCRDRENCRVMFSYQWDNNFTCKVIAGDCNTDEMRAHLVKLAGPDAALWFDRK